MLCQVLGDDGGRDAGLGELARYIQARGDDRSLDGVQHVEARRKIAESVPFLIRLEHPLITRTDAVLRGLLRPPDLEPPVLAPFLVDLFHRTPEIQRLDDGFLHQCRATWRLHHGSGNVTRGNDGVLRRGRGVHQISLVEHMPVELAGIGLLNQDLRGL